MSKPVKVRTYARLVYASLILDDAPKKQVWRAKTWSLAKRPTIKESLAYITESPDYQNGSKWARESFEKVCLAGCGQPRRDNDCYCSVQCRAALSAWVKKMKDVAESFLAYDNPVKEVESRLSKRVRRFKISPVSRQSPLEHRRG